jgi:hypothetical protein
MWDGNTGLGNGDTGRVLLYRSIGGTSQNQYVQYGEIQGSQIGNRWGESVALSYNGNRLALSEPNWNYVVGRVLIYDFSVTTNTWVSIGSFQGTIGAGERWGQSLDLSDSGGRIIIGSSNKNYVKVFQYDSGQTWTQLGTTFTGSGGFGWSVAMDSSGNRVAIGAPQANSNA